MATESVATSNSQQRAMEKLIAAMGTLKVAKRALEADDMSSVEEDVSDSLGGAIQLIDQAFGLIAEPLS